MQRSPARDAESAYAKATKAELTRDYDNAFRLYIKATESFLHLSRSGSATEREKSAWKAQANKALERAEKIKQIIGKSKPNQGPVDVKTAGIEHHFESAVQLTPVVVDHFSPQEQSYVLKKGETVNGRVYPLWNDQPGTMAELKQPPLSEIQQTMAAIWKRGNEYPSKHPPRMALSPQDISQNIVSDCSLCASIAVCLEHARRFGSNLLEPILHGPSQSQRTQIVAAPRESALNAYELKLFYNGNWRRITIDDQLPYHPTLDIPLCLSCASSEVGMEALPVWPSLIEKGYLTLMGGYDFPGSNSCIDIHTLLGWIPEHIDIKSPEFERERTWTRILDEFISGQCMVTLGTGSDLNNQHSTLHLLQAHSYAVIDICETNSERTLTVLDSWVLSNDTSFSSRQKPRVLNISWSDALELFEGLYISWNPEMWESTLVYHGKWRINDNETSSSRQIRVTIRTSDDNRDQEVWVLLTRHVRDTRQTSAYIALKTQLEDDSAATLFTSNDQAIAEKGRYTNSPHCLNRLKIPPLQSCGNGTLSISALYEGPSEDVGFTVTVYSAKTRIAWEEKKSKLPFTEKLDDDFTARNSGGNSTNPSFMINPQYHLRINPPKQATSRSKAKVVLTVQSNKDLPVHIMVVWSQGERVYEPSQKDIVATSGKYAYGFSRASALLSPGSYNVIVSAFEPNLLGSFSLSIDSSERIDISRISQEGAGMYSKIVKGTWNHLTAAGAPSYNRYFHNPVFELQVPSSAQIKVRLQLVRQISGASLNLTVYSVSQDMSVEEHATSGAYDDAISGVATPLTSFPKGTYWLVPSTYTPGVHATFQLMVYSTVASIEIKARNVPVSD